MKEKHANNRLFCEDYENNKLMVREEKDDIIKASKRTAIVYDIL